MKPSVERDELVAVGRQFELPGPVVAGVPYGRGHINDTFLVDVGSGLGAGQFIFQRINHNIFRNIPRLMENIQRVTGHLRDKALAQPGDFDQRVLTLVPSLRGRVFEQDPAGGHWRVYEYLDGTETIEEIGHAAQAWEAARAFAVFLDMLRDMPSPPLHETIPAFHDTPKRLAALKAAADDDCCDRRAEVEAELDFVLAREAFASGLVDRLASGELPLRTTHNDTKINNIRFDSLTGRGAAVIDLDTVMPGLVAYDLGDMLRTCAFEGSEDGSGASPVRLRPDYLEAVIRGFLEGGRRFLTPAEVAHLPQAGPLICLEIGIRFLTDHLQGDVYFKTSRPGQNLARARVQLRRAELLEQAQPEIAGLCRAAGS